MSGSDKSMPLREIPQSLAAEAALLGSITLESACLAQVSEIIGVESFYCYEHRSIYEAMLRLVQREPGEFLDQAEVSIFTIGRGEKNSSIRELRDLLPVAYDAIEAREPGRLTGLSSGFYKLDELTCGFQKGDVIILAGRPSMGNTSLALNIVEDMPTLSCSCIGKTTITGVSAITLTPT